MDCGWSAGGLSWLGVSWCNLFRDEKAMAIRSTSIALEMPLAHPPVCAYNVVTMKTRIIKIGNSQGVRIPKLFLEQSRLHDEVEMEAQEDQIILRAVTYPRQGWDKAFREMAQQGDDQLLDGDLSNQSQWDQQEWQWS